MEMLQGNHFLQPRSSDRKQVLQRGGRMNVHISYKTAKTPDVEREFALHIRRLQHRLQVFRPELVHLHGVVEQRLPRGEMVISINLRLPSGQLAAHESGPTAVTAIKHVFAELTRQLSKHKELLRGEQHRRQRQQRKAGNHQVPFESTLAAVHPAMASGSDVGGFINANLARINRFIERELRYRVSAGFLEPEQVSVEEVLDEAVATALGDDEQKPELLSLERWMYGLALQAIDKAGDGDGQAPGVAVHLEDSARKPNVRASDEPELQFHQPDETLSRESVIADRSAATPEQIAASDEMISLVETALVGAKREDREAMILHGIEGFTVEEISATTGRQPEHVRASIEAAREHLKKHLPISSSFKDHLLRASRIA
jgi:DNA-directed RNA polymerase specialized sigma24 family protein/ribosome-associated translation inhibitor RaiA